MSLENLSKADQKLVEADHLLENAIQESQRSSVDVVTHLICFNSRRSIHYYLHGYLLKHSVEPDGSGNLEKLLDQCTALDPRFSKISLESVNCRHDENEEAYCLGHQQVDVCLDVASQLRKIINSHDI